MVHWAVRNVERAAFRLVRRCRALLNTSDISVSSANGKHENPLVENEEQSSPTKDHGQPANCESESMLPSANSAKWKHKKPASEDKEKTSSTNTPDRPGNSEPDPTPPSAHARPPHAFTSAAGPFPTTGKKRGSAAASREREHMSDELEPNKRAKPSAIASTEQKTGLLNDEDPSRPSNVNMKRDAAPRAPPSLSDSVPLSTNGARESDSQSTVRIILAKLRSVHRQVQDWNDEMSISQEVPQEASEQLQTVLATAFDVYASLGQLTGRNGDDDPLPLMPVQDIVGILVDLEADVQRLHLNTVYSEKTPPFDHALLPVVKQALVKADSLLPLNLRGRLQAGRIVPDCDGRPARPSTVCGFGSPPLSPPHKTFREETTGHEKSSPLTPMSVVSPHSSEVQGWGRIKAEQALQQAYVNAEWLIQQRDAFYAICSDEERAPPATEWLQERLTAIYDEARMHIQEPVAELSTHEDDCVRQRLKFSWIN